MTRMVFCRRFKKEMPGLETPPLPGAMGEDIFENVSRQAWEEWQKLQTMLINEKHLNLREKDARKYINSQRALYLEGLPTDRAEGFVPESDL